MKALVIVSTLATVLVADNSNGCDKPLPDGVLPGESTGLTINSESGVTPRGYRLHIPTSYEKNTPSPLILSFHGRGKTAEYQEALSQFSNSSYGFEGISVYPEGVPVRDDTKLRNEKLLTRHRIKREPSNSRAILMLLNPLTM